MGNGFTKSGELDMACLAAATTPGLVRTLVRYRLAAWGLEPLTDDVCLIAGELLTNAVQCTPDREIRVRFTREPDAVVLAVWDSSNELPTVDPIVELSLDDIVPDAEALDIGHDAGTRGRGLPIVQTLSVRCGVRRTDPRGKWVWAAAANRTAGGGTRASGAETVTGRA